MAPTYYLVPAAIAEELKLTHYRTKTAEGKYILSQQDIRCYGIERAKEEGAEELSRDEAYLLSNPKHKTI